MGQLQASAAFPRYPVDRMLGGHYNKNGGKRVQVMKQVPIATETGPTLTAPAAFPPQKEAGTNLNRSAPESVLRAVLETQTIPQPLLWAAGPSGLVFSLA